MNGIKTSQRRKLHTLDQRLAAGIVRTVVEKHFSKFASQHIIDRDDLVNEVLKAIHREYPASYDPSKASAATFIQQVAERRLVDQLRKVCRRTRNELQFRDHAIGSMAPAAPRFNDLAKEPETLSDQLGSICRRGRAIARLHLNKYGRRRGHPRSSCDEGQSLAIVALMVTKKLSLRGTVLYLQDHPEVREILGLRQIPSFGHISRIKKVLRNSPSPTPPPPTDGGSE